MSRCHGAVNAELTVDYLLDLPDEEPPPDGFPLLLALHGMGMRADRFAAQLKPALPPGMACAVPQAPLPREDVRKDGSRTVRHAWYVYDGDSPAFRARLHAAADLVIDLRTAILAGRPLDPSRVVLLGFSQGGYLAGVAGLRDRARWRGLAVCAARVKAEMLADALPSVAGFPVLLTHGIDDRNVPVEAVERGFEALTEHGALVTVSRVPGTHVFGEAMAGAVREWVAGVV